MTHTTPATAGLAVIEMARQGRFAEIQEMFAPHLRPMVPPEALWAAWETEFGKHGAVLAVGAPVTEQAGPGAVVVKVPVTFEQGELTVTVALAVTRAGSPASNCCRPAPPRLQPPGSRRPMPTRTRSPSRTSPSAMARWRWAER